MNIKKDAEIDLNTLHEFFKTLNLDGFDENENSSEPLNSDISDDEELLNLSITEGEILACIKTLKNNKSSANDRIINEYIKSTADILLPTYVSLFNIILDTGKLPDSWLEGIICPIYKNKGDPLDPGNYRLITILSCFGKLFTSVLNKRLHNFLKSYDILKKIKQALGKDTLRMTTSLLFTL